MLQNLPLFSGLSEADFQTFLLFTQERLVKSGEILFKEGDDATAMYVVKDGELTVYRERSAGDQVLGRVSSGDMVGEMALFDENAPKKRMATVRATSDTLLLVIMDYAILDLSRKHAGIYEKIAAVIRDRNRKNQNC